VLFPIDLSTRRVEIAGIASKANGIWMDQVARNLCDAGDGFVTGKLCLIHDRDPLFTTELLGTLAASGVKAVKLPPRSPNLNPHAKRFVRTIKESCLDRMMRKAIRECLAHCPGERNHQGSWQSFDHPRWVPHCESQSNPASRAVGRDAELLSSASGLRGKASGADRMIAINRTAIVVMLGRCPVSWPRRRDRDAFDRWFEWTSRSVVVDLCEAALFQEEI